MQNLGNKIKRIRLANNLKQSDLAKILFISEKTISSWETNRTTPDLNTIYKIADYFKESFYFLISDNTDSTNNTKLEIKLKVDLNESNKILSLIKNNSIYKGTFNQSDTYYKLNNKDNEWLRLRNEDGKYIFSYKKKLDDNHYQNYDCLIDNFKNLDVILESLGLINKKTIDKTRTIYIYKDKYIFSFDTLNFGNFIEIKFINKTEDFETELYNLLKNLNIKTDTINKKKYIEYIGD